MKKLFLLSLILFGCASSTVYVPRSLDPPPITTFDKETLQEFNANFFAMSTCDQFYVSEFAYIFYMMQRDTTTTWTMCGKTLNSEQKKIWVKYWAIVGWQFFAKQHDQFCKAKIIIETNKQDPRVFADQAAILLSLYLGLTTNFDICSYNSGITIDME